MRKTLLVGLVLAAVTVLVVLASEWLDLELEATALLGVTLGAVVALVPDGSSVVRLAGFGVGFVVALSGYFVRAAVLPDTTSGRAVAFGLIVLAVVVVTTAAGRVSLWSSLLGAAGLAGAFEHTYAAAPTEVVSTSLSMLTTVLLTFAVGFVAASTTAAQPAPRASTAGGSPRPAEHGRDDASGRLDDLMVTT